MGAVATLIYAINHYSTQSTKVKLIRNEQNIIQRSRETFRNSRAKFNNGIYVRCIVLDSPFYDFRDIAKQIATKSVYIPDFLINIALNYV